MIRTLNIDDEKKAGILLNNLLAKYGPDIEIVGLASSVKKALSLIEQTKPGILFLNIFMPGEGGLSLPDKIDHKNMQVKCTSAYDEHAIKALRCDVLDYLLKPIKVDELPGEVKKVKGSPEQNENRKIIKDEVKLFLKNFSGSSSEKLLGLTTQHGISFVKLKEILYCKAEGNYTLIYFMSENKKEIVTKTLKEIESVLSDHHFFRVHRSYLINLQHIKSYIRSHQTEPYDGDGGCVIMEKEIKIPVSRDRRKNLLNHFTQPF